MVTEPDDRPLVLVVDDYEDARDMYAECLGACGFRVVQAETGEQAVETTRALLPAVVLMDLSLPGLDGWAATRILKADPATAHIAIIALTGLAHASAATTARDAGCNAFLTKPCLPDEIVAVVRKLLAGAG